MLKWFKRFSTQQDAQSTQASSASSESAPISTEPKIFERSEHDISRKDISINALKVMSRLHNAGYEAYIVGGGVRDLLLDLSPKDFDIATNAHPEQVKRLFRNSRVIGRRFKLVHVLFGREVIEVATFRGNHPSENDEAAEPTTHKDDYKHAKSAVNTQTGQIIRDNVYGTIDEDANRRDFTINALYYTTDGFKVYDFANGIEDIEKEQVRMIGDPEQRYREDPVRMLRAVRFAAKLDFSIEPATRDAIKPCSELLWHIPAARMFDEVLKLFVSGQGLKTFELLCEHDLFGQLFPETDELIKCDTPYAYETVVATLKNTDERLALGKSVTPAFLYAAMLWPSIKYIFDHLTTEGKPAAVALSQAINEAIFKQCKRTAIPKRFTGIMREILELQFRLSKRYGKRAYIMFEAPRFRAAYDFVLLREQSGEDLNGLGQWWTQFQEVDEAQRADMIKSAQGSPQKKRRRKRKPHKKPAQTEARSSTPSDSSEG